MYTYNAAVPILLMDIDGVIQHGEMFSRRYSREYDVPLDTLKVFFDGAFQDCILGNKDLKDELLFVLHDWHWKKSVNELLYYWFEETTQFDIHVLDTIRTIRSTGIKVYGASNQEHHRARYFMQKTELKDYLDEFFYSAQLQTAKPHKSFFQKIIESLMVSPSDIIYWDDNEDNVRTAAALGIRSHLYTEYSSFFTAIQRYFRVAKS